MDVGKRLKELREQHGFTQNGLAEYAGVSQTHLRRVELGQADITVSHLQLLCEALDVSLHSFFENPKEQDELIGAVSNLSARQKRLLIDFLKSL